MRKYEVFITGKPFVLGVAADPRTLPAGWLSLRIDAPEELMPAIDRTQGIDHVSGVWFDDPDGRVWEWFQAVHTFVLAAGGAVTDEHGRLLVIHRLGLWDLPKGKVEPEEAIEEAAVREVREECGLVDVRLVDALCSTWHTYERKGRAHLKRTDWFLMRASADEPLVAQSEEDIDAVEWADPAAVARIRSATYPSLLPVINAWEQAVRDRA